jgi:Putative DNA-binding domain
MDYGVRSLEETISTFAKSRAYVRAAADRADDHWVLRSSRIVIGHPPPAWRSEAWEYETFLLVAVEVSGRRLASALSKAPELPLLIGRVEVGIPPLGGTVSWQHHPSRERHDLVPLPWPTCEYQVSRQDQGANNPQHGFLIGDGCPSFPDEESAMRAFFFGSAWAAHDNAPVPRDLARIRTALTDAWIHAVRVTPTDAKVVVRGNHRAGTHVEINGASSWARKEVGARGIVHLPLRDGLPDDSRLYLSRGKQWIDHRILGSRFTTSRDLAASGVQVVTPNDVEDEILALLPAGEGPLVEFKRQLPDWAHVDSKRKVMKTVAAFANGEGGAIVFGVDPDELTLVGLSGASEREARDQLGSVIHGTVVPTPAFEVHSAVADGKRLLALRIESGSAKPFGFQTGRDGRVEYYVRRGASTYPATQAEVRELAISTAPQTSLRRTWGPSGA